MWSGSAAISATRSGFVGGQAWGLENVKVKVKVAAKSGIVECSSRPQKKATAHHMKTRPKKTAPWELRRKPTVYDPLPPLPPDWILIQPPPTSSSNSQE